LHSSETVMHCTKNEPLCNFTEINRKIMISPNQLEGFMLGQEYALKKMLALAEYIKASNLTRVHVYEYEAMMYMHSNSSAGEMIRGGFDLAFGELLDMVGEGAAAAPLLTSRVFKRHKVGFNPFDLIANAMNVYIMLNKHPEWTWMTMSFEEQLRYLNENVYTEQRHNQSK